MKNGVKIWNQFAIFVMIVISLGLAGLTISQKELWIILTTASFVPAILGVLVTSIMFIRLMNSNINEASLIKFKRISFIRFVTFIISEVLILILVVYLDAIELIIPLIILLLLMVNAMGMDKKCFEKLDDLRMTKDE